MKQIIANRRVSMDLLRQYERHAKKKFGQNFIIDPSVVKTIAKHSGFGDLVLEIGPGLGALTQQLAQNYKKVIAYEIDPHMVEILKTSLREEKNVTVIEGDFLKADLSAYAHVEMDVCANLPYYITTPILFRLMALNVRKMTLMVQKEIGERLAAQPKTKEYSALTIQIQHYYDVKTVMKVSKESFHPQPKVLSIVVQLTAKEHQLPFDEKEFFTFVRSCFQFRRKTLVNNLKTLDLDCEYVDVLQKIGLDPQVRADALEIEDYIKLYEVLYGA